jgi:hypothetical protein
VIQPAKKAHHRAHTSSHINNGDFSGDKSAIMEEAITLAHPDSLRRVNTEKDFINKMI